jgi:hypothetical protein
MSRCKASAVSCTALFVAESLAKYRGGGTNCSLSLAGANRDYLHRRFAGCQLVTEN